MTNLMTKTQDTETDQEICYIVVQDPERLKQILKAGYMAGHRRALLTIMDDGLRITSISENETSISHSYLTAQLNNNAGSQIETIEVEYADMLNLVNIADMDKDLTISIEPYTDDGPIVKVDHLAIPAVLNEHDRNYVDDLREKYNIVAAWHGTAICELADDDVVSKFADAAEWGDEMSLVIPKGESVMNVEAYRNGMTAGAVMLNTTWNYYKTLEPYRIDPEKLLPILKACEGGRITFSITSGLGIEVVTYLANETYSGILFAPQIGRTQTKFYRY